MRISTNKPLWKISKHLLGTHFVYCHEAGQVLELSETEMSAASWNSRDEWVHAKPGFGWVFDAIDKDDDDRISPDEYREFQAFKKEHKDWEERMKSRMSNK